MRDVRKRIKEIEKEVNRKDKTLAEMSALLTLKNSIIFWRERGRLIRASMKKDVDTAIQKAIKDGARQKIACNFQCFFLIDRL